MEANAQYLKNHNKEEYDENLKRLGLMAPAFAVTESKNEQLTESVTFVDNAGQVKTMSVEDYNKDMHEYHTETQIKPYKRKKIRHYNLLSEGNDLSGLFDEIKKD